MQRRFVTLSALPFKYFYLKKGFLVFSVLFFALTLLAFPGKAWSNLWNKAPVFFSEVFFEQEQILENKENPSQALILNLEEYGEVSDASVTDTLFHRIQMQPYNLVSALIFACAVLHTFCTHFFTALSKKLRQRNLIAGRQPIDSFSVEFFHFMGEVEVVFGIWVIPLFFSIVYFYDWKTALSYMDGIDYTEPLFVIVIMALASTRPIISLAENFLRLFAKMGGETVTAWWWAILTIAPLAGSLITEPGAMTLAAVLLGQRFYALQPSHRLAYATLALLFVNVSVGGVLTHFAAPPVIIVAKTWNWDMAYMFTHFGWKAIVGIVLCNLFYYMFFRRELKELELKRKKNHLEKDELRATDSPSIPLWMTAVHVSFLVFVVFHNHYPVMFLGGFLLFLGFYKATFYYQKELDLKPPILVGFFLGGLVIHGSLQGWWIAPILGKASEGALFLISVALTSFNDNASVTFLASLIPSFDDVMKYTVVAGAVVGGGLTVIANAPNPLGQSILNKYFDQGIAALGLLIAAISPTVITGLCFYFL